MRLRITHRRTYNDRHELEKAHSVLLTNPEQHSSSSCPQGTIFPQGLISCYFCVLFEPRTSFIKLRIISGDSSGAVSEKYTLCCQTKECFREHFFSLLGRQWNGEEIVTSSTVMLTKKKERESEEKEKGREWDFWGGGGNMPPECETIAQFNWYCTISGVRSPS